MSGHNKPRNFLINLYHNLTKTQCNILLLISGNVTTLRQCLCKTQRIAQIYIDDRRKMDNNKMLSSGTANGASSDGDRDGISDRSRAVSKYRRSGSVPAKGSKTKESTVLNTGKKLKTHSASGDFKPNVHAHNPYQYYQHNLLPQTNQTGFVNVLNFPQRSLSDFAAQQSLRNMSLFREEASAPGISGIHQQHYQQNNANPQELRDKENVRNLRQWQPISSSGPKILGLDFTLMSYNVLAQDLLTEHSYLYRNHSPRALLWEQRWKILLEEIMSHNADIICLQEVQESHLQKYYSQLLNNGYASIYKRRTGYRRPDGCALYYRQSMFKCVDNFTVEYNQGYSVLDRDNVAIVAKLAPINNPEAEFVVATTHLLYNPRRQDVRLSQTQVLLAEIDRMAYNSNLPNKYTPIIITGDFNSEPTSAVYKLIVNGTVRYDKLSTKSLAATNKSHELNGKELIPTHLRITDKCQHLNLLDHRLVEASLSRSEQEKLIHLKHSRRQVSRDKADGNDTGLFATGVLSHNLNLQSAYLYHVGNDTEGTTNQDGWIMVDYIFYSGGAKSTRKEVSGGKLKLLARYTMPTTRELQKVEHIPNFALGSDHLALLSKFKLEY